MINLKEKVDNMQEQKRNVSRNVNSQKVWILAIKNTGRENEECLMGSPVHWTQPREPRKESVSLKIGQEKLAWLKCKGKNEKTKTKRPRTEHPRTTG